MIRVLVAGLLVVGLTVGVMQMREELETRHEVMPAADTRGARNTHAFVHFRSQ